MWCVCGVCEVCVWCVASNARLGAGHIDKLDSAGMVGIESGAEWQGRDNMKLVTDNMSLVSDNMRLVTDNMSLVTDNMSLVTDNMSLVSDNMRLVTDAGNFTDGRQTKTGTRG